MKNDDLNMPQWMSDPEAMPTLEQAMALGERWIAEAKGKALVRKLPTP